MTAELRGLGGLVLEQALIDATARPLPSLVQWTRRLAVELGDAAAVRVETNRQLMHEITAIGRRALADPRPIVALRGRLGRAPRRPRPGRPPRPRRACLLR